MKKMYLIFIVPFMLSVFFGKPAIHFKFFNGNKIQIIAGKTLGREKA